MLFRFVIVLIAFIIPLLISFSYLRYLSYKNKPLPDNPIRLFIISLFAGLFLVCGVLFYFSEQSVSITKGGNFVPATLDKNGKIIPSRYE